MNAPPVNVVGGYGVQASVMPAVPAPILILLPSAPTVHAATDLSGVSAAEATTGLIEIWGTTAGNTVSVVVTGTRGSVTRSFTSTGRNDQVFALLPEDLPTIGDGWTNATVTQTDRRGFTSPGNGANFMLDTIAPSAPTVQAATDLGGVTAAEATTALIEIWGTTAGNTVSVVVTGTRGSVTRSFTSTGRNDQVFALLPTELVTIGDGWTNATVTQSDPAGNVSGGNGANFMLDTRPPSRPVFSLAVDTGPSGVDGISADGRIAVTGLESGGSWAYSMNAGRTWAPGTGVGFRLLPGSYPVGAVRVKQTDAAGNGGSEATSVMAYSIRVAVPSAIAISGVTIRENQPSNTVIGSFSTADRDVGDTFSYSLVAGAGSVDNASFRIVGNQLRSASTYDFEAKKAYSIRVRSTDQAGLSVEKSLEISIIDVNEAPSIVGRVSFDNVFEITYEALRTAAKAADPEGGTLSLMITKVQAGSLARWDGKAWVAVPSTSSASLTMRLLRPGQKLRWTPPHAPVGEYAAFTMKAWDGGLASQTEAQVIIKVMPRPLQL